MASKRKRQASGPEGIFLVDKAVGPTSRDIVNDLRRTLDLPGPGHCGTLDPLASGLLMLVSGCATRMVDRLTGQDKVYLAQLRLGQRSATDDAEGPIVDVAAPDPLPTTEDIAQALQAFVGALDQKPPIHSAIRVDGERLYKKARRGEDIQVPLRSVIIHSICLRDYSWPDLSFKVECGAGTYVRSLARDLGEALGTAAHLTALRRTKSGLFSVDQAKTVSQVSASDVISLEEAFAEASRIDVSRDDLELLLNGREISATVDGDSTADLLVAYEGQIVARAKVMAEGRLRMRRMLKNPFARDS